MPRTFLYGSLLFIAGAYWSYVPSLLYLVAGWRVQLDPQHLKECLSISLVLVLILGWLLLFRSTLPSKGHRPEDRTAAALAILFLYLGLNLQAFMANLFNAPGHEPFLSALTWLYIIFVFVFFLILVLMPQRGDFALLAALLFLLAATPYNVGIFPIEYGKSDILYAIKSLNHSLLTGQLPYQEQNYYLPHLYCSYFPALWLAFLPAELLHFDLRYLTLLYTGLFVAIAWFAMDPEDRRSKAWLLVLLLLNPWALVRSDIYISLYLMVWASFFFALRKGKTTWAALAFGWGLSMHLFHWAVLPIWAAWCLKHQSRPQAKRIFLWSFALPFVFLTPFILSDPNGFFHATLLHWMTKNAISSDELGFVIWLQPWPYLLLILAIGALGWSAWRAWAGNGSLRSLMQCLTLGMGLALLASHHLENYYYFVPFALLLFHEVTLGRTTVNSN